MLPKMPRPSSTAATIDAKLSSVSVIAAASRATSVPEMPIATPMSAFLSAGASLTPSPVIATTWRCACSAATTRSLCAGDTRAYTPILVTRRASSASSIASRSAPVTTSPAARMPSSRATARAVVGWSPVIITTEMPARSQVAIASRASGRGGSIMPTRPRNVRSRCAFSGVASVRVATASTRNASSAIDCATARIRARPAASSGTAPPGAASHAQSATMTSGAPFACATTPSGVACSVVIRLVSDSNGISWTRAKRVSRSALSRPAFAAAATSAPSVGSPCTRHAPSASPRTIRASDASAAAPRSASNPSWPSTRAPSRSNVPFGA